MKFSGKMCFKIILKKSQNLGFYPFYSRYIFRKETGTGGGGGQFDLPGILGLKAHFLIKIWWRNVVEKMFPDSTVCFYYMSS